MERECHYRFVTGGCGHIPPATPHLPIRHRREEPETCPRTELRCYGHLRRRHGGSKAFPVAGAGWEPCPFGGEGYGTNHLISSRERNFSIMATVLSIFSSPTASSKRMRSCS